MAKGHRSQIKRERNAQKDLRPRAKVTYARISPLKAKIVLDTIKGKDVAVAAAILAATPREGARIISKVLDSAVANAVNNLGLKESDLFVSECFVNPSLRASSRFR